MTNSQIIYNAAISYGFSEEQLEQILVAFGELPFHTFQTWKERGYIVKRGEHALFSADLWKYTSKPSKAMVKAAQAEGKDIQNQENPHYYKKLSHLFGPNQVERITEKVAKRA